MEPTVFNAKGYFESKEISRIQDAILQTMGMTWQTSALFVPFPSNWWRSVAVQEYKNQLAEIVRSELTRNNGLWGFKDPRTARLLPVWMELVEEQHIDASFVLATRHPVDVAKSLFSREQVDPLLSELLWLEHNADAVLAAGERIAAVVDYDAWMMNGAAQARYMLDALGLGNAHSEDDIARIVGSVISSDLAHHRTVNAASKLPFTMPMYDALLKKDVARASQIAGVFNVSRGFSHVVITHAIDGLRRENKELRQLAAAQQAQLARQEPA